LKSLKKLKEQISTAETYVEACRLINQKRVEEARHTWANPMISHMSENIDGTIARRATTDIPQDTVPGALIAFEDFDNDGPKTPEQRAQQSKEKAEKREREKLMPNEYDNVKDAQKASERLGTSGFHTSGVSKYKPGNSEDNLRDSIAKKKEESKFKKPNG
jgi:hypothetical protein